MGKKILVVDDHDWQELFRMALRAHQKEGEFCHSWSGLRLRTIISSLEGYDDEFHFDLEGAVLEPLEIEIPLLDRMITVLRAKEVPVVFYTNDVNWWRPDGVRVIAKNDLFLDIPLILAALERRPA